MTHPLKAIAPNEAQSYAVMLAVQEATSRGLITSKAADFILQKADELYFGLMTGKAINRQPNGTMELQEITDDDRKAAVEEDGTLVINGDDK